jgi:hypothetical protein
VAWKNRANWTHASSADSLGYFQLGASYNIDRKGKKRPSFYSIQMGLVPTSARLARESKYRLHYPEKMRHVQEIIRRDILPSVKHIYVKALNTTDIIFGDELAPGLGLPSIAIVAPNAIWSWIVNVHTDR